MWPSINETVFSTDSYLISETHEAAKRERPSSPLTVILRDVIRARSTCILLFWLLFLVSAPPDVIDKAATPPPGCLVQPHFLRSCWNQLVCQFIKTYIRVQLIMSLFTMHFHFYLFFSSMIVLVKQLLGYFQLLIQVEHQLQKASYEVSIFEQSMERSAFSSKQTSSIKRILSVFDQVMRLFSSLHV